MSETTMPAGLLESLNNPENLIEEVAFEHEGDSYEQQFANDPFAQEDADYDPVEGFMDEMDNEDEGEGMSEQDVEDLGDLFCDAIRASKDFLKRYFAKELEKQLKRQFEKESDYKYLALVRFCEQTEGLNMNGLQNALSTARKHDPIYEKVSFPRLLEVAVQFKELKENYQPSEFKEYQERGIRKYSILTIKQYFGDVTPDPLAMLILYLGITFGEMLSAFGTISEKISKRTHKGNMAGKLTLLIGRQGTGKSTTFAKLVKQLNRTCLILDPGGATAYKEFTQIHYRNIPRIHELSTNIVRLTDTGDRVAEIGAVFGWDDENRVINKRNAFLNGNLFLEDAGAYLDSNLKRQVKSAIKAFKQYGLNLYLSYHSLDEISTEIIRLQPHFICFKKTGDGHIFSKISKARKLDNYQHVMEIFYKVKFKGLDPHDIYNAMPEDAFPSIAKDLRLDVSSQKPKDIAAHLCKWANGKKRISKGDKEEGKYYQEWVTLR